MRCERCGKPGFDVQGEVVICDACLALIVREWKVQFEEFGELAGVSLGCNVIAGTQGK